MLGLVAVLDVAKPGDAKSAEGKYKDIMFDFLCSNIFKFLEGWLIYKIDNYLLFVLPEDKKFFYQDKLVNVWDSKQFSVNSKNHKFYLEQVLSKILNKEFLWSFYISGHGHHADDQENVDTIVGMPLKQFKTAVLVNRNHKKFPVKADFKGISLSTSLNEHVEVVLEGKTYEAYLK